MPLTTPSQPRTEKAMTKPIKAPDILTIEYIRTKNGGHTTVLFPIERRPSWWRKGRVIIFGDYNWSIVAEDAKDQIRNEFKRRRFKLIEEGTSDD